MLLSAADLTYMQATQEQALPGTVVIERYTTASDGMGGAVQTYAAAGTVIGRIYPQRTTGQEMVGGAQVQSELKWWGTLPVGTEVYPQDRLVYSGRSWEIVRTNNDEMYQTCVRCELSTLNEERRT